MVSQEKLCVDKNELNAGNQYFRRRDPRPRIGDHAFPELANYHAGRCFLIIRPERLHAYRSFGGAGPGGTAGGISTGPKSYVDHGHAGLDQTTPANQRQQDVFAEHSRHHASQRRSAENAAAGAASAEGPVGQPRPAVAGKRTQTQRESRKGKAQTCRGRREDAEAERRGKGSRYRTEAAGKREETAERERRD